MLLCSCLFMSCSKDTHPRQCTVGTHSSRRCVVSRCGHGLSAAPVPCWASVSLCRDPRLRSLGQGTCVTELGLRRAPRPGRYALPPPGAIVDAGEESYLVIGLSLLSSEAEHLCCLVLCVAFGNHLICSLATFYLLKEIFLEILSSSNLHTQGRLEPMTLNQEMCVPLTEPGRCPLATFCKVVKTFVVLGNLVNFLDKILLITKVLPVWTRLLQERTHPPSTVSSPSPSRGRWFCWAV